MNKNNQCYKMFKLMKEGYANNDLNQVEHGARCWLDLEPNNPFEFNSPEFEAFFQMQKCYMIWRRGDIDRKINRRRMIVWAQELCKLNPRQPYKFDKKAEEEDLRLEKEKYEQSLKEKAVSEEKPEEKQEEKVVNTVVLDEPMKVLNVQEDKPEETKKNWFSALLSRFKEGASNDS